jgi:hypothetical protein
MIKTEEELRGRLAMRQQEMEDEEEGGRSGGEAWMYAVIAMHELQWALGE